MNPLTLQEVIGAVEGICERPTAPGNISGVTTDSRSVQAGDLFVALRGDKFDGHDFVPRALSDGAVAAMVARDYQLPASAKSDALLIHVNDTEQALGALARYYRRTMLTGAVTVVAVTGSNGKTTTKTMIAHVLAGRWPGKASAKSFNNQIGVPLTLFSAGTADKFVICEVGTNALGEIAALGKIIEPEIAVVTGVSEAHLAGLGSLQKITGEKLSLLTCLRADGCGVVNYDCEPLRNVVRNDRDFKAMRIISYGRWSEADLRLTALEIVPGEPTPTNPFGASIAFTVNDHFRYQLNLPGRHNVHNALAAIAVARRFGMDHDEIAERLATFVLPPMRMNLERLGSLTLINDAYNANPASLAAAIDTLRDMPAAGRRVAIVGDMRELGGDSDRLHAVAAQQMADAGLDMVIAVGEKAEIIRRTIKECTPREIEIHAYSSTEGAKRRLTQYLEPADTILVKGSRALALEKLVEKIRDWSAAAVKADS